MRKFALISVYDKEGVSSIANSLLKQGFELLSTGGTKSFLEKEGFEVCEVSELTGEPERFGGRVKTLHHKILGAILFRPDQDEAEWPYDFRIGAVVCNFYPFQEKSKNCKNFTELMDWVDIGGPTMVRAAAKNHEHVLVMTDPKQYSRYVVGQALGQDGLSRRFALQAFRLVEELDRQIYTEFYSRSVEGVQNATLRYGENPHQKASFSPTPSAELQRFGELSFNNVRDSEAALRFVLPFKGKAVAVVKHQTLCGAAASNKEGSEQTVFEAAWEGDPVSRYGGILAFNFSPTAEIEAALEKRFVEVLVAPRSEEAEAFAQRMKEKKPKLRILLVNPQMMGAFPTHTEIFSGALGELRQESDSLQNISEQSVTSEFFKLFGQWSGACSKSNAIAMVGYDDSKGLAYLAGVGQGQPNRVDSLKLLALPRAKDYCQRCNYDFKKLSCFSDAFIPFRDTIDILAEAGIKRLFQPGGSKKDTELSKLATELGLEMIMTRERHFWH